MHSCCKNDFLLKNLINIYTRKKHSQFSAPVTIWIPYSVQINFFRIMGDRAYSFRSFPQESYEKYKLL